MLSLYFGAISLMMFVKLFRVKRRDPIDISVFEDKRDYVIKVGRFFVSVFLISAVVQPLLGIFGLYSVSIALAVVVLGLLGLVLIAPKVIRWAWDEE